MMQVMAGLPAGVVGVRAQGKVTKTDYERVVRPLLKKARKDKEKDMEKEGEGIRFVFEFAPSFKRYSFFGVLADLRTGLAYTKDFERCAVVSDSSVIRSLVKTLKFLVPYPVRIFNTGRVSQAVAWVAQKQEPRSQSGSPWHQNVPGF
jgi:hypothetical protein